MIASFTSYQPLPASYTDEAEVGQLLYLHRDHQGSVDTITDINGEVVERLSFHAFGERRMANWGSALGELLRASNITRGYTGHEHLDGVGLIHMNGRVYDASLGRFLSADPFVQQPKNLQSLNRYSYVVNNPLTLTDPSGFFFKKIFKGISKAIKGIGRAVGSALQNPYVRLALAIAAGIGAYQFALNSSLAAGASLVKAKVIAGAAGGFAGGFVGSGGDLKAAVVGGLPGAAAGYIGANTEIFGPTGVTPQRSHLIKRL